MTIKIGTIVTIDTLGPTPHVIIDKAHSGGYWVQNLVTGALPITHRPYPRGFMPREMTETGTTHLSWASLACQPAGTVHSTDTVTHYSGTGTPEELCGYHALANTDWRVSA
jgi:hypothetical protein